MTNTNLMHICREYREQFDGDVCAESVNLMRQCETAGDLAALVDEDRISLGEYHAAQYVMGW